MKTDLIRWDESMAVRCLNRLMDAEKKMDTGIKMNAGIKKQAAAAAEDFPSDVAVTDAEDSIFDRQWIEFEQALSKALSK